MAKADSEHLIGLLAECPPRGTRFQHYKGGLYQVVGAAILEAQLEPAVIYRPLEGAGSAFDWIRLLSDWNELVQRDGGMVPRFQRIDP
jgi:hypothetical protein